VYEACSVPIKAAALALALYSSCESISEALISHRLQNWFAFKLISAQGLVPASLSFVNKKPGSPLLDASIFFHKSKNVSLVIYYEVILLSYLLYLFVDYFPTSYQTYKSTYPDRVN
jgi:hypothetical protein